MTRVSTLPVVSSQVVEQIGDEKEPRSDFKHNVINVRNSSFKSPFKKGGNPLRKLTTVILNNEVPCSLDYESGQGIPLLLPV
jgi:hypothetical protein